MFAGSVVLELLSRRLPSGSLSSPAGVPVRVESASLGRFPLRTRPADAKQGQRKRGEEASSPKRRRLESKLR